MCVVEYLTAKPLERLIIKAIVNIGGSRISQGRLALGGLEG